LNIVERGVFIEQSSPLKGWFPGRRIVAARRETGQGLQCEELPFAETVRSSSR
jgi:hypothetical protein